jgi:hypothetical protein
MEGDSKPRCNVSYSKKQHEVARGALNRPREQASKPARENRKVPVIFGGVNRRVRQYA